MSRNDLDTVARTLPIYACEQEILRAVKNHQVVVVEGPAGTGKTTQLPRMLWRANLARRCIGITQPRRIAAVSVAWRIAAEEGAEVGREVGYAIRFDDHTGPETRIKLMTDGILLQEARSDPELLGYDVLMIDEAHERSLNIDLALGILHRLVVRRADLRVVVSSATLRPGQFQRFFAAVAGEVPRVLVGTRVFPVTVEHLPPTREVEDLVEAVAQRVLAVHRSREPGDVLVFLPGEALIRRTQEILQGKREAREMKILPLFGRLTRLEQERVFKIFLDRRKVVLATNIAETSITIPGVNFVIDTGLQKLPWFNPETCVTSLREEPASQAQLAQRAGRAGRTGPGRVLRLFSESSFEAREPFTPEEILRIDLSEAVLRLIDLGISNVEEFPFPTPPAKGKLRAALRSLRALGAIDKERRLTPTGKRMVPFPLGPHLARMVVEAAERFPRAMDDVLIVAAFLSVRSPFLYPAEQESKARRAHQAWAHPMGDVVAAVNMFRAWLTSSDSKERKGFCRRSYLDEDTMGFIGRAHTQLIEIAESRGMSTESGRADPSELVRCVAAGFLDRLLLRMGRRYETLAGTTVSVHPSSTLYGRAHRFLVATELRQAGRVYAFNLSVLRGAWVKAASPEAATRWRLHERRRDKEIPAGPSRAPTSIHLNGVELRVKMRGGRLHVEIPQAQLPALTGADLGALPPESVTWRARVLTEHGPALRGSLQRVIAVLPFLALPEPGKPLPGDVPSGALLELDRNFHTLARFLDRLLEPMQRHKRLGYLALVGNGSGGYWYEVLSDFVAAVWSSAAALEMLGDAGAEAAPIAQEVARAHERVSALKERLEAVL